MLSKKPRAHGQSETSHSLICSVQQNWRQKTLKLGCRTEYFLRIWNCSLKLGKNSVIIIENDEKNADAHYNLGFLYAVSTDRKEDALTHLKQAFTIEPNYEQARYIYDMIQLGEN